MESSCATSRPPFLDGGGEKYGTVLYKRVQLRLAACGWLAAGIVSVRFRA
jgi:hypothetical protein